MNYWADAGYLALCVIYGCFVDYQGRIWGWKYFLYLFVPCFAFWLGRPA